MTIREVLKHGPLAGLLWVLASPGLASADEVMDLARKRYESGERDYVNGRFWQAAKAFEEAFDLSKRPDLLFNAARAYDRGEYAVRAIETYEAYLKSTAASDQAQIELRLGELRKSLATLKINTKDKAFVSVDGHEYGQTPMSQPIPMDSGYHRIEVRDGNKSWATEQAFTAGQLYTFEVTLSEDKYGPGRGLIAVPGEDQRPKQKTRRAALVASVGGSIDITGSNFPPHQASINLGGEYRVLEGTYGGLDVAVRIPIEVGNSWTNAGFVLGIRGALTPLPRLPLELVGSLDAGFSVLDVRSSAPLSTTQVCASPSALPSCTLYGARIMPALSLAYRIVPAAELRLQLIGVETNLTSPLTSPRLNFALGFAYRFL